tara:strand:+ start:55 stop:552 length:498 start_codon:yes stop_codon:yes gene_type:complete
MKNLTALIGMLLMSSAAQAGGLVSVMSSSVQLNVDAAKTTSTRIGNSYSVTGSGVATTDGTTTGALGGLGAATNGVNALTTVTASQATSGEAFSFTNAYTQGDAVITTAPTVGEVSAFSSQTSYTAGTAGDLAGTIGTDGALTITAGGAGTSAIGQFTSEITVLD